MLKYLSMTYMTYLTYILLLLISLNNYIKIIQVMISRKSLIIDDDANGNILCSSVAKTKHIKHMDVAYMEDTWAYCICYLDSNGKLTIIWLFLLSSFTPKFFSNSFISCLMAKSFVKCFRLLFDKNGKGCNN